MAAGSPGDEAYNVKIFAVHESTQPVFSHENPKLAAGRTVDAGADASVVAIDVVGVWAWGAADAEVGAVEICVCDP